MPAFAGGVPRLSIIEMAKSWFRWLFSSWPDDPADQPHDDNDSAAGRAALQAEALKQPPLDVAERRSQGLTLTRTGSLHQAHDFVLNYPVFHDGPTNNDSEAIKTLAQHVLIGAEFDSGAREPPPRCHEQTRKSFITKIQNWLHNPQKEKKMLWLNGPTGVGKSAIMQTFAEAAARFGRLGAGIFFSRANQRSAPERVVPTLAFQLAVTIPSYRAYIVEQLTLNPLLLNKSMREQFQKLIIEPFAIRNICAPDDLWCMLLDGLDECQTEDAQCGIVQLISDFIHQYPDAPLVWVVASRPEEHLKIKFALPDISPNHWSLHVSIDEAEACEDVQLYLRSGFRAVRLKYPNATPSDWPSDEDFSKLAIAASGLFIFASTIIRFVEEPGLSDPVSQLQIVLRIIRGRGLTAAFDENPFAILDALYSQILSSIHPNALRCVRLLLGHSILRGNAWASPEPGMFPYTLLSVSNLLGLQPNVVYGALQKLHSVLHVPSRDSANRQHLEFLHGSFVDYIMDPQRSQSFAIDPNEVHSYIWRCYHRIIQEANGSIDDNPSRVALSWPCANLEEMKCLSSNLLREARYLWAHYLVPTCYCTYSILSPSPAWSISFTTREKLGVLEDIDYNLLSENYCGLHDRHVFAFCTWFLDCWNSLRNDLESRQLFKEIPISELSLNSVATSKLAWVCEASLLGLCSTRYYSNDGKYLSRNLEFSAMEHLIPELSWLKLCFPETRVFLCENKPRARGAFIVYYTAEEDKHNCTHDTAFYYLPLHDVDEIETPSYSFDDSAPW